MKSDNCLLRAGHNGYCFDGSVSAVRVHEREECAKIAAGAVEALGYDASAAGIAEYIEKRIRARK